MSRIHCIIFGRVQLVMYRDFAQRKARMLKVTGTVTNLKDGTVEVFAEATKEILEKYIALLKQGSLLSKVKDVKVEWADSTTNIDDLHGIDDLNHHNASFGDFKIIY